jgi:hypothetical protein
LVYRREFIKHLQVVGSRAGWSYLQRNIIRKIKSSRMSETEHVALTKEERNSYRGLVGKPEGKIPLERPRRRIEDNIKIDVIETELNGMDCIYLVQDRDQQRALVDIVLSVQAV